MIFKSPVIFDRAEVTFPDSSYIAGGVECFAVTHGADGKISYHIQALPFDDIYTILALRNLVWKLKSQYLKTIYI